MKVSAHCEAPGQSSKLGAALTARFSLPQGTGAMIELQGRFHAQLDLHTVSPRAVNM